MRLRLSGGYGEYRYTARVDGQPQSIYGTAAFADLLVGYQMAFGGLTLKAFAGATFDGHLLDPFDEANKTDGAATGVKGVDRDLAQPRASSCAQLDLSYGTAHSTYNSRARLGYRLPIPSRSASKAARSAILPVDNGRGGAFVRYDGWPASFRCRAASPAISPRRATLTERSSI